MKGITWGSLGVLVLALATGAWAAGGEVIETVGSGEINWSRGIILAKGSGAPPREARNIAQARLMAERAALADARRNLLEVLRGVRVDSVTRVENHMLKDDQIRLQAEGFIQGSAELRSLRKYLSDGAIEVTVAMSLSGDFLSLVLPLPPAVKKDPVPAPPAVEPRPETRGIPSPLPPAAKEERPIPPPPATPAEKKPDPPAPPAQPLPAPEEPLPALADLPPFSGAVIDTRGLGMKPALAVRVLGPSGKELYRGQYVPQEKASQNGLVLYSRDLTAAQTNPRVGKNPLTVKGHRLDPANGADILLAPGEASRLAPFAQKGTFLEDCRVMIVLD